MRLIDADKLKEEFTREGKPELWHYTGIGAWIDSAPTIDAVEVVRCKDCIYFLPDRLLNSEEYPNQIEADGLCTNTETYADNNDYCSYGERKALDEAPKE